MFSIRFIIGFLIVILLIHAFATIEYWYWAYEWLDIPMHFLGGFWAAAVFIRLNSEFRIKNLELISTSSTIITILFMLSFVALIGVLWEFAEFLHDIFALGEYLQQGAADTIGDLFFDLLGGAAAAVIFLIQRSKTSFVS